MTAVNTMNSDPRGDTTPRGAVLVVGDRRLLRDVMLATGDESVEHVEHYLMALGHLAGNPASVIVGRASLLHGAAASMARSLRRLAPGVRLVLIAEADEEPEAIKALEVGFDEYLVEPMDLGRLAATLQPSDARPLTPQPAAATHDALTPTIVMTTPPPIPAPGVRAQAPAAPTRAAQPDSAPSPIAHLNLEEDFTPSSPPPAPAATQPVASSVAKPAAPPVRPVSQPLDVADEKKAVPPAPQPAPVEPRAASVDHEEIVSAFTGEPSGLSEIVSDDELGDVDLVDQLLSDRRGFRALAIRMVAARSGVMSVAWADKPDQIQPGRVSAPVEHRGRVMGYLHADPGVTAETLQSWASWLGHWAALERRMTELWDAALHDELTGVWNRRYFNRFLDEVLRRARADRFRVTLMLFDIDDFKLYNDRYGHDAGDEILREASRLMRSSVRDHDVVARIGGDEFAVIFWDREGPRRPNSSHPTDVSLAAERFRKAICEHKFPKLADEARGNLTISGGLASFPWDGQTREALLSVADSMAIRSKQQGKNVVTLGPGAAEECRQTIKPE